MPLALIGGLALATAIALKVWRKTQDNFYLTIAVATLLFAVSRIFSLNDAQSFLSILLRLVAFLVLIGDMIRRRLVM